MTQVNRPLADLPPLLALLGVLVVLSACSQEQESASTTATAPVEIPVNPAPTPVAAAVTVLPQIFDTSQSIRTLMNFEVQPNVDAIWQAVRYVVTTEGVQEDISPQTDEDWVRLRDNAIALVAAGNALLLTNREVDADYPRDDYPDYTYTPGEIRQLIEADPDTWRYYIQQMQSTTNATLEAINNRDLLGLLETGATINNACQGCHAAFWYRP